MKLNRALLGSARFTRLVVAIGGRTRALGILAEVYILARDYYLPLKYPVPKLELEESEIPVDLLVELGFLVEKKRNQYYLKDIEETFRWYFDKRKQLKAAAIASAKSKKHHTKRDESGKFKKVSRATKRKRARPTKKASRQVNKKKRKRKRARLASPISDTKTLTDN